MGMVRESEDMQKEICEILLNAGYAQLISEKINAGTELSVRILLLSYDVVLGGKKILSMNHPENAITVYRAMLADFRGNIYIG